MRSKAPLALMEQMVMLLVFALAAALCLQAFVQSDAISQRSEARDRAVELAQSVAEVVKSCHGDLAAVAEKLGVSVSLDSGSFQIEYTENWELSPHTGESVIDIGEDFIYHLGVYVEDSDVPGLGRGGVWVKDEINEIELFRIEIAWQEVDVHG